MGIDNSGAQIAIDIRKLNESLMNSIDLNSSSTLSSLDDRSLETLKKTLFELFRSNDKQDLGVVSYKECQEVCFDNN